MWEQAQELWKSLGTDGVRYIRDFALALLGAIARLAYDHRQYDGINIQFCYALFRTVILAWVAVVLVEAIIESLCLVSPVSVALVAGAGFFSVEFLYAIKRCLSTLIEGIVKGFFPKE